MNKAMRYLSVIIPALFVACVAMSALAAPPVVNVTAATGGGAISNSNIANTVWTSLTGPVLTETAPNGIGAGTIVLAAPTGFKFNTAAPVTVTVGLVAGAAAKNLTLTSSSAVVTASTITITVATSSSGTALGSLTWSGIKVMPTACTPLATGNITMSATSTSVVNWSPANLFGSLTETGSTALTFIQQPTNTLINTSIAPSVTLNACGSGASLPNVTVALTTPAGATLGGTLSIATNNATGLATFSSLSVNLVGTYTLTATSPGLTSATSSSFIIYYPTPTTTSISPVSANLGGASFVMTVNGTNFVPASVARFNGASRATTYVSATQLTVTILASDLTVAGTFPVDVVNPVTSGLGGGTSNSQSFQVLNITPGRFNTFETSTAAGAIVGNIFTKIAGSTFTLDVVALNLAKTAVLTTFTGAVKVEILDASNNSGALDANNCRNTWATIQTLANPTFVAANNGRKSVNFTENNSWKEVRIRVSYPATGAATAIGCSTDNFAIRPNSLSVSVTDTDWQTAGITRTLSNTSNTVPGCSAVNTPIGCTGTIHKAGQPFTLQATALNAAAVKTTNYTGTPSAVLSACAGTACTATFGTFSTGAGTAVAGVINSTTATYSEVGAFTLQLQDQTFSSVDAADGTPANCTGQYVCSATLNVGRFVPDHFGLSAASITNRADLSCPACVFTYMGEQMNAVFTLTAQAAGNTTTQNYAGVLAMLNPAAAGKLAFAAVDSTATPTYLTARLDTSLVASGSFASGVANVVAPLAITRGASADGPYASLDIGIAPTDSDGVIMSAYDLDTDAVAGNDHSKVARTEVRYGRMKLSNAHGSELLPLPIVATVQYWNGTMYATSATDSETQFNTKLSTAGGNVQAAIVKGPLTLAGVSVVTPGLATFANGINTFKLGAPSVAGSVDLTIITAPSYLVPSATARATFGVYKGANEFIYLRENY